MLSYNLLVFSFFWQLKPVKEVIEIMSSKLIEALHLTEGSEICVMLSNTGAVSILEMYGLCNQINKFLGSVFS